MNKYIVRAQTYRGVRVLRIRADSLDQASRKAKAKLPEGFYRFRVREAPS